MTRIIGELPEDCLREFANFMTGELIGRGMSRAVFAHPQDKTKIIKIENSTVHFQNVIEWQMWQKVKDDKKLSRWLAPCHAISYNGTFLIMERARNLEPDEVIDRLPCFIGDHKRENFGVFDGRIVCRDYGVLPETLDVKMRKWHGD